MNMFEEAESIKASLALRDMTQAKLGRIMGVSQPYIANKLRLLDFSYEAREKITEYGLSERHARTILRLPKESLRLEAIEKASKGKMNVALCEVMVDSMLDDIVQALPPGTSTAEQIGRFERSLESSLSRLRRFGIFARSRRVEDGERIYYTVTIG